jgi:hypothetical protein
VEALVAIILGALIKEAPDALLKILRAAGVLSDDADDEVAIQALHRSVNDIMASNPMKRARP